MKRDELTAMFVLDVIADDYESLETIYREVSEFGERCGITFGSAEIRSALLNLIETDLARAYRLSPLRPGEEIVGVPVSSEIDDLYFLPTERGKEVQLADFEGWPFDERGSLRKNWIPPEL